MLRQRLRIVSSAICLILATTALCTYAYACGEFDFLLYQQKTRSWNINLGTTYYREPRTINIVAESDNKKDEYIVYYIEIHGPTPSYIGKGFSPRGFSNKDITLSWKDSTGKTFTIGNGGNQAFTGTGTLNWHSGKIYFKHRQTNTIILTMTFLATAPLGKYKAEMWIDTA